MSTVPIPADRVAWLQQRQALQREYVSASDAGALLDCHPFMSPADMAVAYLNPQPITEDAQTDYQARGHYLERSLSAWLSDELGVAIVEPSVMYADRGFACTPDGEFVGSDTDAPEFKSYAGYLDGDVLPYWRCQAIAHVAARPSLKRIHFAVLDASLRFQHYVVEPSPAEIDTLVSAAENFLACMQLGIVPEGVVLSWSHLKALHPREDPGAVVELDDEGLQLVVAWEQTRRARLDIGKDEEVLKAGVAALMGDAAVAVYDGLEVVTWRTNRPSPRMDWRAAALTLAEEAGVSEAELLEAHTSMIPGARVLRRTRYHQENG